jgi:hypothetical protein
MAIPLGRVTAETEGHEVAEAHASFETFFEQTHQRLFGGLCLVTGNRHDAEEIMQDAYLKVWERWGAPLVVTETGVDEPAWASVALAGGHRMRLYVLDLPEGCRPGSWPSRSMPRRRVSSTSWSPQDRS